ncbi:MAG: hypothetical protein LBI76_12975 [Comamonas sp.]|jgi:hypothetical protein|nr:hypothetical protein [Comamonas sp.]
MKRKSVLFWVFVSVIAIVIAIFLSTSFALWWTMERKISKEESQKCIAMSPEDMERDIIENIKYKKLNDFYTTHNLDNYSVVNLSNLKDPNLPRVDWTFDLKSRGVNYYLHGMIDCSRWKTEYSVIR